MRDICCLVLRIRKEQVPKLKSCTTANDDWYTLTSLKNNLHPLLVATMAISSSKYPSLAARYLIIKYLRGIISADHVDDSEEFKTTKALLLQSIQTLFRRSDGR